MTRCVTCPDYQDCYEYHGSTMIERLRRGTGRIVKRDWLLFDSVEEAQDFFNTICVEYGEPYDRTPA
jgi:hypothetical protein